MLSANLFCHFQTGPYTFKFDEDITPTITSITPRQGTTETKITIEGKSCAKKLYLRLRMATWRLSHVMDSLDIS